MDIISFLDILREQENHNSPASTDTSENTQITEQDIWDGLHSSDVYIRLGWAIRDDWSPNSAHVEVGLHDPSSAVRSAWLLRRDVQISRESIQHLLSDEEARIRAYCADREDWQATAMDIERGLLDEDSMVVISWL